MRTLVELPIVSALVLFPTFLRAEEDEPVDAYEIVTTAAVPVLPPTLRSFFKTHIDTVKDAATAGLSGKPGSDVVYRAADSHYVMLDIAAGTWDAATRRAAARLFPRDRAAATALFKRHGRREGGSLPWILTERWDALAGAFQTRNADKILRAAGVLVHYTTDATLPFNATADREGTAGGCIRWSTAVGRRRTDMMSRTARGRCQSALLGRSRKRLAYEVRVFPGRYTDLTDPRQAVFEMLLEAHEALEPLLAVDADATAELGIVDAASFAAAADAYYERVKERAVPIMECRLEEAALLAARLIASAWIKAGRPAPNEWTASTALISKRAASADNARGAFVGSRSSTVFHRATCSHARRIKPANRVFFDTAAAARRAGRVPCKSCKPEGSGPK